MARPAAPAPPPPPPPPPPGRPAAGPAAPPTTLPTGGRRGAPRLYLRKALALRPLAPGLYARYLRTYVA